MLRVSGKSRSRTMVATSRLKNAMSLLSTIFSFCLPLEVVHMLVDALQAAVGLQQLRRGLVADAGHAGDVVGRVALEAEEVDELVGAHAVTLEHLGPGRRWPRR